MDYILDTNILLYWVRGQSKIITLLSELEAEENRLYVSIVSAAEILSLAHKFSWGKNKLLVIENLLAQLEVIMIDDVQWARVYADIDAFSQQKHPTLSLPLGMSARNMGKNDLWIATTATILTATLLTTDKDFLHLHDVFFDVECVEI